MEAHVFRVKRIMYKDASGHWSFTGQAEITNTLGNAVIGSDQREEVLVGAFIPTKKRLDRSAREKLKSVKFKGLNKQPFSLKQTS